MAMENWTSPKPGPPRCWPPRPRWRMSTRSLPTGRLPTWMWCGTVSSSGLRRRWTPQRELPLYRHDAAYAREQGNLDLYRASRRANIACKEAIERPFRNITGTTGWTETRCPR